jgi:hypothetical protein
MLNSGEFGALLDKGRALQKEIVMFTEASPTFASSCQLIAGIDALLKDIKQQLLSPSFTENSELGLVMVNLGRLSKNLNDIKNRIKI